MKRVIATLSFALLVMACNEVDTGFTPVVEYGDVEGIVKLSDGGVAAGIDVRLTHVVSTCWACGWGTQYTDAAQTTADDEGRFQFSHVRAGRYAIFLGAYEGYAGQGPGDPSSFVVSSVRTTSLSYVLTPVN